MVSSQTLDFPLEVAREKEGKIICPSDHAVENRISPMLGPAPPGLPTEVMPARADQPPQLAAKRRPRVWPMAAPPRPLSSLPAGEGSLPAQLKAGRRVAATQGKIADSGARSSGLREHGRLSGRWSVAQKPSGTRSPRWGWEQRVLMHSEVRGSESSACRIQHLGSGGGWRVPLPGLEGRLGRKETGSGY